MSTSLSETSLGEVVAALRVDHGQTLKEVHGGCSTLARSTVGQALTALIARGRVLYEERPRGNCPNRLYWLAP